MFNRLKTILNNRKYGNTLSETLIALAVIGIVFTLSVGTFVADYNKNQTVVRLKKVYGVLSQAFTNSSVKNGNVEDWDFPVKLSKEGSYSVLDLCQTPLFACQWYAKREKIEINTICTSIFDLKEHNKFDLICTDAFLTRFSKDDMRRVISVWYDALSDGGNIVTTIRIHDDKHICPETPADEDIELFRRKAFERSKIWGNAINYSQEQVSVMAETYARKMKSNSIGSREDVLQVFGETGFEIIFLEDVDLQGELYPSRYLRIRAVKGERHG